MEQFRKYFIGIILCLATILRLWNLGGNPPGLTWDEAALGYNAYSILQTGRDEYGSILPLTLRSFGDYKPALYAYLTIPFVLILGLNELAVRLPSAIFGVLGIWGIYLLTEQLFQKRWLSLLAALFLAISPWHIQFSRPAFEANVALTLNIFAAYFFLKSLSRAKLLILSALFFGLSLLTYQASKLFVPLITTSLILIYWNKIKINRFVLHTLSVLAIFLALVAFIFLRGQTSRLSSQNFFAYQRSLNEVAMIAKEDGWGKNSLGFEMIHGEWWAYTKGLVERYTNYFSPKMLFIDGDYSQRHRVPDLGTLFYFSVILIPLGIIFFVKLGRPATLVLFSWLLLAPLPAVLSRDLISILRALNMVVPLTMLEAAGFYYLIKLLRQLNSVAFKVAAFSLFILFTFNFLIYLDRYFIHAPKEYSKYWLYGYSQVLGTIKDKRLADYNSSQELHEKNLFFEYNKVVITDSFGQPYIYYLFYTKYPPRDFQRQAALDQPTVDVGTVRKIDNIEFRHIFWPGDRGEKNTLYVGTLEELPDQDILPFNEFRILKDIDFLNGERAFRVVETK